MKMLHKNEERHQKPRRTLLFESSARRGIFEKRRTFDEAATLHSGEDFLHRVDKWIHIVEQHIDNDRPVDAIVIVDKPMPQTSDHVPWLFRIGLFELTRQLVDLFPDVIQRCGNCPLRKLIFQQKLRGNVMLFDLNFQAFPSRYDLFEPFFVRFLQAIFTPSRIIVS